MGMFRFYDFIFPLLIFVSDVSIVLGKVAHRLCNLVHCTVAAVSIGDNMTVPLQLGFQCRPAARCLKY